MRWNLAVPMLGALALMTALPDTAEARRRSSFDISVGLGYSNYGGHRGYGRSYDSGVSFRYSRGYSRGYDRGYSRSHHHHDYDRPRYYAPRPAYRSYYPVRRYYRDDYGYGYHGRPLYRRYYRDTYYYDDDCY
jgi:hypothetical protein